MSTYRFASLAYDAVIEPLLRGARDASLRLAPPQRGMRVLDVGCGTGSHLVRYAAGGAQVVGLDRSRAMLRRAALRLRGRVVEGDARRLPVRDGSFDLVVVSMVLHELDRGAAGAVLGEARRAARCDGALLVVDYIPEPPTGPGSRLARRLAATVERIAGGDHYRNYRSFTASGGLPELAADLGMTVWDGSPAAAGAIGAYLVR